MLEFDTQSHRYTLDGVRLPHVTQVTDALSSYAGVPAEVLRRKAEIGDAVHYATELDDAGDLDDDSLPDEIRGYVDAWRKFKRDTGWVTHASEQQVYSPLYRYAGTLDCVGHFERHKQIKPNALCILDKKCTFMILPAVGPQIAAYLQAWNEPRPKAEHAKHRFACQLKPDGTYHLEHCAEPTDWSTFLSALTLLNWRMRHKLETTE